MSAWADPRLAYAYLGLEAISDTMQSGSAERGCIRDAMAQIELADRHVKTRSCPTRQGSAQ